VGHVAHLHEVRRVHRNDKATSSVGRENGAVQAISNPSPFKEDPDDGPNFVQKVARNNGVRPEKHGTSVEEINGWIRTWKGVGIGISS